jgi:hypothetical protein
VVFDVTGQEAVEVGRLELARHMWDSELLLVGDRVLVLSGAGGYYGGPVMTDVMAAEGRMAAPGPWGYAARTTFLTVDVSDPASPTAVEKQTLEASLVSARQYGDVVRIITTSTPSFDFVYPGKRWSSREARQHNREIVRDSTAADWLPKDADGEPIMSCTDVSRPDDGSAMSTISILTLDPSDPSSQDTIGVAASGDLVYSSSDQLYVATSDWGWGFDWWRGAAAHTDIHAFELDGLETTYTASGDVPGYVPDRWAFSEHEDELRVASTRGDGSESLVTVLAERGENLVRLGSVGGMGKREDIKAVRWFGDIAVVVTFRTMDPLYTLDLSDADDPRLLGELKIPGFSEYLHPVGGDILLGVGQRATMQGVTKGSQVQTFDLRDLTDPRQIDSLRFNSDYSPVEHDSRAFTYLIEQRLALVPTGSWSGDSTVEVVRLSADGSLETVTSLELPGWTEEARAVPLGGDRVALVARGTVQEIVDVSEL